MKLHLLACEHQLIINQEQLKGIATGLLGLSTVTVKVLNTVFGLL